MTVTVSGTTITFNDATTQTTAPVNTNANVTSVSAGTGISVSSTTGAVVVSSTVSGGVSSLNGQTGAITNTNFNAIGSVGAGGVIGNGATYNANATVSGGSIVQAPGPSQYNPFQTFAATAGSRSAGYSGTWRAMADSKNSSITPKSGGNYTVHTNLWMRIS